MLRKPLKIRIWWFREVVGFTVFFGDQAWLAVLGVWFRYGSGFPFLVEELQVPQIQVVSRCLFPRETEVTAAFIEIGVVVVTRILPVILALRIKKNNLKHPNHDDDTDESEDDDYDSDAADHNDSENHSGNDIDGNDFSRPAE